MAPRRCAPPEFIVVPPWGPVLKFGLRVGAMGSCAPVYVIDDDPGMLESTGYLLGSLEIEAKTFSDPMAFLQEVSKLVPGCVLSDLSMPTMTGIELHEALVAKGISWPVVLMSGHSDRESNRGALHGSMVDFIEKPFTVPRLLEVLENALRRLC
jgi:FixJ family two-component response regulator